MREKHGTISGRFLSGRKWLCLTAGIIAVLVFLLFLFYALFEPLLTRYVLPTKNTHAGMNYYKNDDYKQFESGPIFYTFLEASEIVDCGEVSDFYHIDNRLRDNPLYGKVCDIFSVDITLSADDYKGIKSSVIENCQYACTMDQYKLYVADYRCEQTSDVAIYALCDDKQMIRCILITDLDECDPSWYGNVLDKQSTLSWN